MAQYGATAESSKNIWGFDPTSIAGCTLWLDGADATTMFSNSGATVNTTAGGDVLVWRDKSISGNNAQSAITNTIPNTRATTSPNFPTSTATTISYCVPMNTSQWAQGLTTGSTMSVSGVTPGTFNVSNATISSVTAMFSVSVNSTGGIATYTVTPSTLGLLAGSTVVVFGFSNAAFNGTFTMATQTASTFTVANATSSGGTLTGGTVLSSSQSLLVTVDSTAVGTVTSANSMTTGNYTVVNTQYPTRGSNTVSFNGNQYFSLNGSLLPTGASDATYFCVSTATSGSTRQSVFAHGGNQPSARILGCGQTTDTYYFQPGNTTGSYPTSPVLVTATNNISSLRLNNQIGAGWTNGSPWTTRQNQDQQPLLLLNTSSVNAVIGMAFFYLVQSSVSTSAVLPLTGTISEILVFNTALTNAERQQIEGYLAHKWNLIPSLPTTHPYYNNGITHSFVPPALAYCSLWLDADDISTMYRGSNSFTDPMSAPGTSLLGTWADKSGNNNYAYAVTSLTPNVFPDEFSGRNVVSFNGATFMTVATTNLSRLPNGTGSGTYFIVSRTRASPAYQQVLFTYGQLTGNANNRNAMRQLFYSDTNTYIFDTTQSNRISDSTASTNKLSMMSATQTTLLTAGWINGNPFSGGTLATNETMAVGTEIGTIGAGYGYVDDIRQFFLTGDIAEIIVFNTQLSTAQREDVEGYLAWKWGMYGLLPVTHRYASENYFYNTTRPFSRNFVPTDIDGCQFWIDPADRSVVTVTGSNVTAITDKSGQGNSVSNAGSTLTYATTMNGLPTIVGPAGTFNNTITTTNTSIVRDPVNHSEFYVYRYSSTPSSSSQNILPQRVLFSGGQFLGMSQASTSTGGASITLVASSTTSPATINLSNTTNLVINQPVQFTSSFGGITSGVTYFIFSKTSTAITVSTTSWGSQFTGITTSATGGSGSATVFSPYFEENNNIVGGNVAISFPPPVMSNVSSYDLALLGNTYVVGLVRQNAVYTLTVNGAVVATAPGNQPNPNLSPISYQIQVGNQNANIGDVIIYNSALNATDRQKVEGYLMWKWGLRGGSTATNMIVPLTHPFYKYPPPALTPLRPTSQLFNRQFTPYDLSPTIWLDPQDVSTYTVDANNRATSWRNKGVLPAQTITITTVASTSILTFTGTSITNAVIGQPIVITGVAIAGSPGLTPGTIYYIRTITSQTNGDITVSSTPTGAAITTLTNATGLSVAASVSSAFTIPLVGTGTGITGPLVTTSSVGAGLGQQYFDFSSGGTFNITGATVGASPFTALTLTTAFAHNIPVGAMIYFVCQTGSYPGGASATINMGPFQISSASVAAGGTTLNITTQVAHGIAVGNSVTLTINTGTFLGGGDATSLSGTYTAQAGTTGTAIVLTIASSTVGQMAIIDGHVGNNVGTSGYYLTQSGTTGSTIVLTSYSARASAGALSNFIGRVEYGIVPFTSAILTSTTSMTLRTPIDHGITSGSVNVNFQNLTMPFQVSLPTTGTAIGQAGLSFTSATVSGGTTLTISGITNPFFVNTSPTPTYTGITTTLNMTFPTGTFFSDGTTSATGRSGTGFVIQAGSNATTLVLTIASSPNGALIFRGVPGMVVVGGTPAGSFINNTQTITSASGNTIVIPIPTYSNAIVGRVLAYPNPSIQITLPNGTATFTSYLNYPVVGYALENTALVSRLNTSAMTIVWVSHYNPNHFNPSRNRSNDFNNNSPVISAAVALNGAAGADTTSNGRDFKITTAAFAGNAPRLALLHNNTYKSNFFNFALSDTSAPFRVNSCVMNFTGTSTSDVPASTAAIATYGWRYEPAFLQSTFQSGTASQPSATLAPTHLRIGANTNATTTYTTHPLSGFWYEGGVGDILIFNSILTLEQRQLVEGFLAHKYRCQAALGAPVTSNSATYNIAGGSISGSGPFTVTLTGSFPIQFIIGSTITIAGVTNPVDVYNTTRTVLTMAAGASGTLTFQSATNIGAWVAGGTVTGSVTFVHPYRLNPLFPSGSTIYSNAVSLWLDAADRSTFSNSGLSNVQWNDKSGNNRHATNNGGAGGSVASNITYVTDSQNGLAGVQIVNSSSTNGLITPANFPLYSAQQVSFFVVARLTGGPSAGFISNLNTYALWSIDVNISNLTSYVGTSANITTQLTSSTINLLATTFLISLTITPTSFARGFQTLYVNGTSRSSGTGTIPTNQNSSLILSRDNNNNTTTYYEVIAFANAISDVERQQLEGYLAWKWGIQTSLPTTHPYYRIRP